MALGALAVVALPREEEPQIIVPMADVFVEMPGATPADVEQRVTRPLEQLLWGQAVAIQHQAVPGAIGLGAYRSHLVALGLQGRVVARELLARFA